MIRDWFNLIRNTFTEWSNHKAPRLGAALAYYTIFSIAPLLLIATGVAALLFGEEAARGQIMGQLQGLVGREAALLVQDLLAGANRGDSGLTATVVGLVLALLGASGVVGELRDALNTIWDVPPREHLSLLDNVKQRLFLFALVVGLGLLMMALVIAGAVLMVLTGLMQGLLAVPEGAVLGFSFIVTLVLGTGIFALIYKVVPEAVVSWHDVLVGGAVTAVLFAIGKVLIEIYLALGSTTSAFGAAGSLVALLLWVYYSAQILFLGAEFTQVYSKHYGSGIRPAYQPRSNPATRPQTTGTRHAAAR